MIKLKKKDAASPSQIVTVRRGRVPVSVVGTSPFVFNAVSFKTRQELLMPKKRRTDADLAERGPKHDPMQEFKDSVYAHQGNDQPTRLMVPCGAFKGAMETAALDMPDMTKSKITRLVWIEERDVNLYGIPQIYMTVVRNSDMNRTPDVRTRAIVKQWACQFTISYAEPLVKPEWIPLLLIAGGIYCGVGDGRQEKGYGFGQFEFVRPDDKRIEELKKTAGREAQDLAMAAPENYDLETARLLSWYMDEMAKPPRSILIEAATESNGKGRGKSRTQDRQEIIT